MMRMRASLAKNILKLIVLIEVFLSRTRTGASGTINIQEEAKVTKERNSSDNRQTMRIMRAGGVTPRKDISFNLAI